MATESRFTPNTPLSSPGPYLAKIVSHIDSTYMGGLEVELLHDSGADQKKGQYYYVKYLSPFLGQTNLLHVGNSDTFAETQKSYGFWMVPPDPGVLVVVIFIDGDPRKGYWLGCVQDYNMNFMMPGYASTELATDKKTSKSRVPVAEYNKITNQDNKTKSVLYNKPATPQEVMLDKQGLLEDDARGITTSSARREVPSSVFGVSTPGPIDKLSGKKGDLGKKDQDSKTRGFVNRLTGSTFVMDDGDDKWERKKTPWEGPPEYADVEAGETGLRDRPHNELIRLRTRT